MCAVGPIYFASPQQHVEGLRKRTEGACEKKHYFRAVGVKSTRTNQGRIDI